MVGAKTDAAVVRVLSTLAKNAEAEQFEIRDFALEHLEFIAQVTKNTTEKVQEWANSGDDSELRDMALKIVQHYKGKAANERDSKDDELTNAAAGKVVTSTERLPSGIYRTHLDSALLFGDLLRAAYGCYQFGRVCISRRTLQRCAKTLKDRDVVTYIEGDSLRIRWNGGRGGLNLRKDSFDPESMVRIPNGHWDSLDALQSELEHFCYCEAEAKAVVDSIAEKSSAAEQKAKELRLIYKSKTKEAEYKDTEATREALEALRKADAKANKLERDLKAARSLLDKCEFDTLLARKRLESLAKELGESPESEPTAPIKAEPSAESVAPKPEPEAPQVEPKPAQQMAPSPRPTVYTVGQVGLTADSLKAYVERLGAVVVDIRTNRLPRPKALRQDGLESTFGPSYVVESKPTAQGLLGLAERLGRPVLVLGKEEAPGDCPRHNELGLELLKLGIDTRHIFDGSVVLASELERSFRDDDEPAMTPLFPEPKAA